MMKRNKIRIWQRKSELCWTYGGLSHIFNKREILLWKKGWRQRGTFISKTAIHGILIPLQ